MTKSEVRSILNQDGVNYYSALKRVSEYLTQEDNKEKIVEYIYGRAKSRGRVTALDLVKFFMEPTMVVVEKTRMCKDKNTAQRFLKTVWDSTGYQTFVVSYMKEHAKLKVEKSTSKDKNSKPKKEPASVSDREKENGKDEMTTYERQVRQAQRMREAKARKAKERKMAKEAELKKDRGIPAPAPIKKEPEIQKQEKKISKEMEEHIALLKGMKV
jgi:hypothetical protein